MSLARGSLLGVALAVALVLPPTDRAPAAHPCEAATAAQLRIAGTPRAGQLAVVRSAAPAFDRLDWGDGTPVRPRTTRSDGTLRHRYRRAGSYMIVASQNVSECCDASHANCTPAAVARDRLRIRVRAARR